MGKFEKGDRVVSCNGDHATVLQSSEQIVIEWDENGNKGNWPATLFELLARKFKRGQYVRVVSDDEFNGNVGMVIDDDGGHEENEPYEVAIFDDNESEEWFSASELEPWLPEIGERVIEVGQEDDFGTVLSTDGVNARVMWDDFPHAQNWPVADLEPAIDDDVEIGDTVNYSHPMFSNLEKCTVVGVGDGFLNVVFDSGFLPPGNYSNQVFQKAA